MDLFEVRELQYFLAVAEELHFTRAAQRLGIAQPPLSRAIRRMEQRLGVDLFQRDTHRVRLTSAGMTLLDEARTALDAIAAAARRTRRATLPVATLVATAKPGVATGLLRRIAEAVAALPGGPAVEIVVSGYGDQADMVRDGRADVALLSSPYDVPGIDTEPLTSEPRVAALPAGHRLTRVRRLRCADLAAYPIPQWTDAGPEERAYWSGGETVEGPAVSSVAQLLDVVSLGQAVALVPQSVAGSNPRTDLVYRPVVDASPYTVAVAWPTGSRSRTVAAFVRAATNLAGTLSPTGPLRRRTGSG